MTGLMASLGQVGKLKEMLLAVKALELIDKKIALEIECEKVRAELDKLGWK